MATTTVTSNQFRLSLNDFWKGLIMFVGTPVLYALQEMIPKWHIGSPSTDVLAKAALSALVTYLLKNFFDKPKVVISDQATVTAVKDGTSEVTITPTK